MGPAIQSDLSLNSCSVCFKTVRNGEILGKNEGAKNIQLA
jgi:hypothetical protein